MDLYKEEIMMKVLSRLLCLVLCLPLLTMGLEKITWEIDGKEMVLIPAGSFQMGDQLETTYLRPLGLCQTGEAEKLATANNITMP